MRRWNYFDRILRIPPPSCPHIEIEYAQKQNLVKAAQSKTLSPTLPEIPSFKDVLGLIRKKKAKQYTYP